MKKTEGSEHESHPVFSHIMSLKSTWSTWDPVSRKGKDKGVAEVRSRLVAAELCCCPWMHEGDLRDGCEAVAFSGQRVLHLCHEISDTVFWGICSLSLTKVSPRQIASVLVLTYSNGVTEVRNGFMVKHCVSSRFLPFPIVWASSNKISAAKKGAWEKNQLTTWLKIFFPQYPNASCKNTCSHLEMVLHTLIPHLQG